MLGRKDFTKEELAHGREAINGELAAWRKLTKAVVASGDKKALSALEACEPIVFNNMLLTLDRYYVHRLRVVAGKDGNPLNEVEVVADSLMNNGGVFRGNNVVKYDPASSVLHYAPGDAISVTADDFQRLSDAFFEDLEAKFVL